MGEGLPTLRQVAELAGVHVGTASRALSDDRAHLVSDETRARVRTAAETLGYRANVLARGLRRGVTATLGIVVPDLANPFTVSVLRGIEAEALANARTPLIAESHDEAERLKGALERMLDNRVDGIIVSAVRLGDEALICELERRLPVVLAVRGFSDLAGEREESAVPHYEVLPDDVLGGRLAAEHLIRLGHTRIAQLAGASDNSSFARRSAGYRRAVARNPGVADVSGAEPACDSTVAEGVRLGSLLFDRPPASRPTAVFAHNDLLAVGVIDALRQAGLHCPGDVSVVGYNDAPLIDHIDPPLTTVRLPSFQVGAQAARLAFELSSGARPRAHRTVLEPELVVRGSTAAAPGAGAL